MYQSRFDTSQRRVLLYRQPSAIVLNPTKNSHVISHVKFDAELEHFTFQNDYFICEILNLEICCKQINVHEKVNFS